MVLITLQIAINSEKLQIRTEYLSLFQYFNKQSAKIEPGLPYLDFFHYVNFIVALVLALLSLEFIRMHPAFHSLLFILSFAALVLVTLQYDLHELQLFRIFFIAKMPALFSMVVVKASDYIPFLQVLLGLHVPFFQILLFHDHSLKVSMITVIQVAFHVYFLVVWLRKMNWDAFYATLGPLNLLFCWFAMLKYFFYKSSPEYITYLLLFGVAVMFALPMFPLGFLISPVVFLVYFGFTTPFFYSCGLVVGVSFVFLVLALSWKYLPSYWINLSLEYVFLLVVAASIPFILYLSAWYTSVYQPPRLPAVSLEEYGTYCGPRNWNWNSVQTQINCIHLQGRELNSEGTVKSVRISEVVNNRAESLRFLPASLQSGLTCLLGERQPMCGDLADASTCLFNGCHFHSSLKYSFEIKLSLKMDDGYSISTKLIVPDRYRDIVLKLGINSVLKFSATFVDGMGTEQIMLQALHVKVDGVPDKHYEDEKEGEMIQEFIHNFLKSLKKTIIIVLDIFLGLLSDV